MVVHIDHPAVLSDDPVLGVGRGREGHQLLIGLTDGAVWIDQDGKGHPEQLDEVVDMVGVLLAGDPPDLDSLVLIALPEALFDVRDLGRTDRSPGGEVDQDDGHAPVVRESIGLTIESLQSEVGGL